MRLRTLLSVGFLALAAVGLTAAGSPPATFELTLVRTGTGWSATCATGCAWTEVSMECAPGCQAVISESGMRTQRAPELAKDSFAFVVEPRGVGGWQAVSIRGTAWSEASVGCDETKCRTWVDDTGVTRL